MKTWGPYYGGKSRLQHLIQPLIIRQNVDRYCEPFAGAASTFFEGDWGGVHVTLNDRKDQLINFYRVIQNPDQFEKLLIEVNGTLHSQSDFSRAKKIYFNPRGYSKVMQAWAFWAGFVMSHMADLHPGAGFRNSLEVSAGINKEAAALITSKKKLKKIAKKMESVTIKSMDAMECIKKIDSPKALFFIDPPYCDSNMGHFRKTGWDLTQLKKLCFSLENIKGKFILTHTMIPEIQEFLARNKWQFKEVEMNSSICYRNLGKNEMFTKKRTEVIIWNYQIQKTLF